MSVQVQVIADLFAERDIEQQVIDAAADRLIGQAAEGLAERLWDAIGERAMERVEAEFDKVLTQGWYPTDRWGERQGEPVTVPQLIRKLFTEQWKDSYSRGPAQTRIERLVKDTVETALKADFGKEVKKACDDVKKQLTDALAGNVRQTVLRALGVKD